MTDEAIPISTSTLIDVVHMLAAFGEVFQWGRIELAGYNDAVRELGPALIDEINARCAAAGVENAVEGKEWDFMAAAGEIVLETVAALAEALRHAGIEPYPD